MLKAVTIWRSLSTVIRVAIVITGFVLGSNRRIKLNEITIGWK